VGKRILSKVFNSFKPLVLKRGQFIFKENDVAKAAYLIKEGECEVTKVIYDNKYTKDSESGAVNMAEQNSQTKKFKINFSKAQGVRPSGVVRLCYAGQGKMVGEDELIRGCNHLTSVMVTSQEAKLYKLKKDVTVYLC
jgi:CRP-like cAMP-binding protein